MLTSPSGKSYVGQTIRPIEERFKEHQRSGECVAIYNAIKFHGWEKFDKDWYECPDNDLNKHEELMIEVIGTLSPGGYNLKEGGGSNGKMSEETKKKMSKAQQGENNSFYGKAHTHETRKNMSESRRGENHHNYGKSLAENTKQKISESHLGKTHTEETKQKLREENIGKTHTVETKQKMKEAQLGEKHHRSKKVYQYDLDGNFSRSFSSGGEAARYLGKKDGSKISSCARGCQETAYGFKWSHTKS